MSKNIIIQEGGTDYQFTATKLKTNKVGGGTCLWVPEDEVNLKTKRITTNGKHIASDDGAYGFKSVNVNVKGGSGSANSSGAPVTTYDSDGYVENAPGGIGSAVVGTDSQTGEWITVGVDSNGNLVSTPIPASIVIITPPTKTSYNEGETIDFSGIVVGLKTNSGNTFTNSRYPNGHIPTQELIFPVTIADISDN